MLNFHKKKVSDFYTVIQVAFTSVYIDKMYILNNNLPGLQITPTSSLCLQLCVPQPACPQSSSISALDGQARLSNHIRPESYIVVAQ